MIELIWLGLAIYLGANLIEIAFVYYDEHKERKRKRAELKKAQEDAVELWLREQHPAICLAAYNKEGRLERVDSVTKRLIEKN